MKNYFFIPFLILSFVFFIQCTVKKSNNNLSNNKLKKVKDIVFKTGFSTFKIKNIDINGENYLGFADFQTRKKIVVKNIHNENDGFEINLKPLIQQSGEKVQNYEVISSDSILISTFYTNNFYLINKKGEILSYFSLDSILNNYNEKIAFEVFTYSNKFLYRNQTLIFKLNSYYKENKFDKLSQLHLAKRQEKNIPNFLKIDSIWSDTPKYLFGLENFYDNFIPKNCTSVSLTFYNVKNNDFIVCDQYSDSLYIFNFDDLKLKKKIKIKSKNKIYCTPFLTEKLDSSENIVNDVWLKGGHFNAIVVDNNKNILLPTYYPTTIEDSYLRDAGIIFLDSNYNYIEEVNIDTALYMPTIFPTNDGFLIHEGWTKYRVGSKTENRLTLLKYD